MVDKDTFIRDRVQAYFLSGDHNCAMSSLKILAEHFRTPLAPQVVDAAQCVPGIAGRGETCGLVVGVLMFIGVWGAQNNYHRQALNSLARRVTNHVEHRFGSLCCQDLQRESGCGPLAVEMLSTLIPVLTDGMTELQKRGG
jgi:C_GCAxxG_C_C family probable redox protein